MKKLLLVALVCITMLGIIAGPAAAQTGVADVTLWADNMNINVGNVNVSVEGDNLIVTLTTVDGWTMTETHVYAGTTAPTKSAPGKFPSKHEELGGVTSDTHNISLSAIGAASGSTVYIAAQAAIEQPVLDELGNPVLDEFGNPVILSESAWGEGSPIPPARNWAMAFSVVIP